MSEDANDSWPRSRWVEVADQLLLAVRPHASSGRALINLPGPTSVSGRWSDGLEGFARTFLLAAFRVGGAHGQDLHGLLEQYAHGLACGTNPDSVERWPRMTERRQARVEAASIAIALSETRLWLWDKLDERVRERTVQWLADIVGTTDYGNNWIWFQNVVESFLASVGGPWSQRDLDRNAELQERLYVGDGWYSDGAGPGGELQNFDYYTGWAWHLYPVLEARIRGAAPDDVHRNRLRAFLEQAPSLVGADGAPVLQGRSLTYRFAMLAPFWAGALADATPLEPGETRAITSAVMRHFLDHGAVDNNGLLPVGWYREFPRIRQLYTGAASPYWASKAFAGLLLSPDDPIWTDDPVPPQHWERDSITLLSAPGWLVQSTAGDGVVRVVNHGTDRQAHLKLMPSADDPFYHRQSYSTHSSPQLLPETIAGPVDSHTALLDAAGLPSHRGRIERVHLSATVAVSRSRPYWLDHGGIGPAGDSASWSGLRHGPMLTIASVVRGSRELRLVWIDTDDQGSGGAAGLASEESPWLSDPGPWRVHIGGWPLAAEHEELVVETTAWEDGGPRIRVCRSDGFTSLVQGVQGLSDTGALRLEGADPLGAASVTPWIRSRGPVAAGQVTAALVSLSGMPPEGEGWPALPEVETQPEEGQLIVRWPDGHEDTIPG
ncbi:DUF2264 domain-containing protein [Phytoactinopolyspora mesophila]|uniref:DUF2264 domain-containing protein n=1 Tax=Phytoactinopolyspora mesophila TaxID=2650750 RepID=UPI001C9E3629